jgi:hypothetical protein
MKIRKKRLGEGAADYPEFHARFDRFKSRTCLHNIKLTGESEQEFVKTFSKIVEKGVIVPVRFFILTRRDYFGKRRLVGSI